MSKGKSYSLGSGRTWRVTLFSRVPILYCTYKIKVKEQIPTKNLILNLITLIGNILKILNRIWSVIYYFSVADAVVALGGVFSYGHRRVQAVSKVRLNAIVLSCTCLFPSPLTSPPLSSPFLFLFHFSLYQLQ